MVEVGLVLETKVAIACGKVVIELEVVGSVKRRYRVMASHCALLAPDPSESSLPRCHVERLTLLLGLVVAIVAKRVDAGVGKVGKVYQLHRIALVHHVALLVNTHTPSAGVMLLATARSARRDLLLQRDCCVMLAMICVIL